MRACCATAVQDAEVTCTAAIREVEATCVDHACILQQSHRESMQDIEREAIEEEGRDWQSFLTACRVALQACPPEACRILMYPLQLLTGNMSLATLLAICPKPSTAMGEPNPVTPHPIASVAPVPISGTQTAIPLTQPGDDLAMVRRWRSHRDLWGEPPPEAEKWEASSETPKEGSVRSLHEGLRPSAKYQVVYFRTNCPPIWTMRSPMTYLIHSGRWWILLASLTQTSTKFRTHGLDGKNSALPRPPKGTYSSSTWWCQLNHQASWGWRGSIPQKSFTGMVAAHTAHGALRRGRMREPSLTTSEWYTIAWAWYAPSAWAFMPWVQIPWGSHAPSCKAMATRDRGQAEEEVFKDNNGDEDDGYLL